MSKKLLLFVPIFIISLIAFSTISPVISMSNDISKKVLRLHILANSDSKEDQELKFKIRDEILKNSNSFSNCNNIYDAVLTANNNIEVFTKLARKVIEENGYNYDVKVYVDNEYFNVREYNDFALPSGYYNTIKIVIGQGKGHNWWCVMYPSVCISGCTKDFDKVLTKEEKRIITSKKYIPKFKLIEIINKLKMS